MAIALCTRFKNLCYSRDDIFSASGVPCHAMARVTKERSPHTLILRLSSFVELLLLRDQRAEVSQDFVLPFLSLFVVEHGECSPLVRRVYSHHRRRVSTLASGSCAGKPYKSDSPSESAQPPSGDVGCRSLRIPQPRRQRSPRSQVLRPISVSLRSAVPK